MAELNFFAGTAAPKGARLGMAAPKPEPSSQLIGHYDLADLRAFQAVAESGSISKAARVLRYTKSMVSQRVAKLERALGVELFVRSPRGVQLTERGAIYLAQASEALHLLESAAEAVASDNRRVSGTLRISAPVSFATHFLGGVLCEFLEMHPSVQMQLELHDHQLDLSAEGFELGVRITNRIAEGYDQVTHLANSRRVVCCSPEYARRHGVPRQRSELAEHRSIAYTNQTAARHWQFREQPTSERFSPMLGRLQTNNGEVMRDAAAEGLGLIMIPLFIVANDLRSGRLVAIRTEYEPQPDGIFAVIPTRKTRLVRVRMLLEHLKSTFSGTLPWERDLPAPV